MSEDNDFLIFTYRNIVAQLEKLNINLGTKYHIILNYLASRKDHE